MKYWLIACLLAASLQAAAQQPNAAAPLPGTPEERLDWTPIRGAAVDLSIGADGVAFAVDRDGKAWIRRPAPGAGWMGIPGSFTRIDAASERLAWAVDPAGAIFRFGGTFWQRVEGRALDIGTGPEGAVFAVAANGVLVRFDPGRGAFAEVPQAPGNLSRVDVDARGFPWVVEASGRIHRFDGTAWVTLPGTARDLSIGVDGTAYSVGTQGQLWRWVPGNGAWTRVAANAMAVAVAPNGNPWIVTPDSEIYANEPNSLSRGAQGVLASTPVFSQRLNWRRMRGVAQQVAISASGAVLVLGRGGELWQWRGRDDFVSLPGRLSRIALAPDGAPWGVDAEGRILRSVRNSWVEVPGRARDIAIGALGAMWIIQPDGIPAQWQPQPGTWQAVSSPLKAEHIAVDPAGAAWILAEGGKVYRFGGGTWETVDGVLGRDIAVGPEGSVVVAGNDNKPYRYDTVARRWEPLNGEFVAVAVGPRGFPWAVTERGEIFASSLFDEDIKPASSAPAAPAAPAILVGAKVSPAAPPNQSLLFQRVSGAAARAIAIGGEGSVFVVGTGGTLSRWSNRQNRFIGFPGQFQRIAVAPDGKPWGVSATGVVFRHDGTMWREVFNITAVDIAVGLNGTVMVTDANEVVYRYLPAENRFDRILPTGPNVAAPTGTRIAIDPRGHPWTVTKAGVLFRCDKDPCERMTITARTVAIGPEGTVFVTGTDDTLRRYDPRNNRFDILPLPFQQPDQVAVGPLGKPWVVNRASEVWYSAFFPRNEDGDAAVVSATLVTRDTTPPTTTVAPAVSATSATGTTLSARIDEDGTGFYLALPSSASAPTVAAVIAANNRFAMRANVTASAAVGGLSPSTAYRIYFVARDGAGNVQSATASVAVTTASNDTVAPTFTALPAATTGTTTSSITVKFNESGTGFYLVQQGAQLPAPTAATVVASGTSFAVTANVQATVNITGLQAGQTPYLVSFVARDAAGNVSVVNSVQIFTQ